MGFSLYFRVEFHGDDEQGTGPWCLLIFSFYLADLAGDYLKNSAFYLR